MGSMFAHQQNVADFEQVNINGIRQSKNRKKGTKGCPGADLP